jgi:hypothetical protein
MLGRRDVTADAITYGTEPTVYSGPEHARRKRATATHKAIPIAAEQDEAEVAASA